MWVEGKKNEGAGFKPRALVSQGRSGGGGSGVWTVAGAGCFVAGFAATRATAIEAVFPGFTVTIRVIVT